MARVVPSSGGSPSQLRVEVSAFVRWIANIKEVTRTFEMSVDLDVQERPRPISRARKTGVQL